LGNRDQGDSSLPPPQGKKTPSQPLAGQGYTSSYAGSINRRITIQVGEKINTRPYSKNNESLKD
jgi:hypothetical protein